jgi:hypothetical protein
MRHADIEAEAYNKMVKEEEEKMHLKRGQNQFKNSGGNRDQKRDHNSLATA